MFGFAKRTARASQMRTDLAIRQELRRRQGGGPVFYQHHAVSVGQQVTPTQGPNIVPDLVAAVLTAGLSIPFSIYRHRRHA